jgi:AraC-like DNA-binding protein
MSRQNTALVPKTNTGEISPGILAKSIAKWIGTENHLVTKIPTLTLYMSGSPTQAASYILPTSICLIAQGAKQVLLGEEAYRYDAQTYLITSVDLPVVAQITEASIDRPYLGLTLELDQQVIAQLITDSSLSPFHQPRKECRGIAVSKVTPHLLDALIDYWICSTSLRIFQFWHRLFKRRFFYRLLAGDQGPRIRQVVAMGSQSNLIAKTIDWMKHNFTSRLSVDNLASYSGMSISTFHHHIRSLTAMSPLQYQKKLRLNEARRLMLMEDLDATTAAFHVGYESSSQFSREYNRLFGAPPLRDMKNLHRVYAKAPR